MAERRKPLRELYERVTGRKFGQILIQVYEPAVSPVATAEATKLTATISAAWNAPTRFDNTVVKGDVITISGKLVDATTGAPIVGAEIFASRKMIKSLGLTDIHGNYSGTITASSIAGTHHIAPLFPGNELYNGIIVFPAMPYNVEARTPDLILSMPASGMLGESIVWSGTMTDPKVPTYGIPSKNIYLQESVDVTFSDVMGPVLTDREGRYSGSYTLPSVAGTYYYRTRYPGGSDGAHFQEVVSPPVAVAVGVAPVCENRPWMKRVYDWAVANNRPRIVEWCKRICERGS